MTALGAAAALLVAVEATSAQWSLSEASFNPHDFTAARVLGSGTGEDFTDVTVGVPGFALDPLTTDLSGRWVVADLQHRGDEGVSSRGILLLDTVTRHHRHFRIDSDSQSPPDVFVSARTMRSDRFQIDLMHPNTHPADALASFEIVLSQVGSATLQKADDSRRMPGLAISARYEVRDEIGETSIYDVHTQAMARYPSLKLRCVHETNGNGVLLRPVSEDDAGIVVSREWFDNRRSYLAACMNPNVESGLRWRLEKAAALKDVTFDSVEEILAARSAAVWPTFTVICVQLRAKESGRIALLVLDNRSGGLVHTFTMPGSLGVEAPLISHDEAYIYLEREREDGEPSITVLDMTSGRVLRECDSANVVGLPWGPMGMSPDRAFVFGSAVAIRLWERAGTGDAVTICELGQLHE